MRFPRRHCAGLLCHLTVFGRHSAALFSAAKCSLPARETAARRLGTVNCDLAGRRPIITGSVQRPTLSTARAAPRRHGAIMIMSSRRTEWLRSIAAAPTSPSAYALLVSLLATVAAKTYSAWTLSHGHGYILEALG